VGCNGSKKADIAKDRKFRADAEKRKEDGKGRADGKSAPAGPVGGADGKSSAAPAAGGSGSSGGAAAAGAAANQTPTKEAAPGGPGGDVYRSPAKGIATPNAPKAGARNDDGNEALRVYGTSLTNKRTKEHDMMHRIVEQTQNNFIDVQHKQNLDEEAEDRSRAKNKYKQLGESGAGAGAVLVLEGGAMSGGPSAGLAPLASSSSSAAPASAAAESKELDVVTVLTGPQISEADHTLMSHALTEVCTALASTLAVRPTGAVVLSFAELQRTEF